jgi:hypothetical protein
MKKRPISPAEALNRAHHALLEDVRTLEIVVSPPARQGPAQVAGCLEVLREHISEHFRFEEQDGYMEAVRQRQPNREREMNQLQDEHVLLARSLDDLITEARAAREMADSFRASVRAWVERVRQHEVHENRLVQEAFNQDVSAED